MASRAHSKPIVYIVFRFDYGKKSTRYEGFVNRMKNGNFLPDAEYRCIALSELVYVIDKNGIAGIFDKDGVEVLHDASFVYFKSWEKMPEKASAIAIYLQAKGIPFEDHHILYAGHTKLPQMFRLWASGISVIPSVSTKVLPAKSFIENAIGDAPYIVKPASGEKGNDNYLCQSYDDISKIEDFTDRQWLIQPYIENEGDYRIWVYGYEVYGAIFRQAAEGSHLNNTSKGGTSAFISPTELDDDIIRISRKAAKAVENAVAGVDILPAGDGRYYVLEVNQGSQIVTGHEREKKMAAFGQYMDSRLHSSYKRIKQPNRLAIIGRHVKVNIPEFKVKDILAKVDTGAYQSALHASNIKEVTLPDGAKALEFIMLDGHERADGKSKKCIAHEYDIVSVTNTSGVPEVRYRIKTAISLGGRMMKTPITLTDRSDMMSPLLLGRRFLRGRYLVNVELSRSAYEETL
jgi:glutathione synthase/RimK-type ligase-like ATP-grasp enzyme